MTFNVTIDGPIIVGAILFSILAYTVFFLIREIRRHNKDMKLIDQTADDRKKLLSFMYMKHIPEDLAQKLKDEFNAVDWEIHQESLKTAGSARRLYPTFVKTYEWILK